MHCNILPCKISSCSGVVQGRLCKQRAFWTLLSMAICLAVAQAGTELPATSAPLAAHQHGVVVAFTTPPNMCETSQQV